MKIAIMGAGTGGTYLYRLLKINKLCDEVEIFGIAHHNRCGTRGCSWVVNYEGFAALCSYAGIDPNKYVLKHHDRVIVNGSAIPSALVTINKPDLIKGLCADDVKAPISVESYDRIIDATGSSRAYLPGEISNYAATVQELVHMNNGVFTVFKYRGGYSWIIPISESTAHIGAASLLGIDAAQREFRIIESRFGIDDAICQCAENVIYSGIALPIVSGNIWGVGEAVGLIEPITGSGIIATMESAKIMLANWNEPRDYELAILKKYGYINKARKYELKFADGKMPSPINMLAAMRSVRSVGLKPSVLDVIRVTLRPAG